MGSEDGCNTGLVLGLGSSCEGKAENRLRTEKPQQKPCLNLDRLFPACSTAAEPSLTLCLLKSPSLDETHKAPKKIDVNKVYEETEALLSSPHSTISSFSNMNNPDAFHACIKRERDVVSEEFELERVSSRASDEDEEGSARKKLRLTKDQSALLEDSFKEHSTLNPKQKQALAKQLNLRPRQVEVWFQNRRARTKLKQTEVDCEFLKRCCETLTDENRKLQKELQELKALKFSSPLYMQLPAATLSMCPSCERLATNDNNKTPFSITPKSHFYNPFTHSSAAC